MIKWIGQHIFDLIARFRSDVYLESIETDTIVGGGNLGLDANGKIVKNTVSGGGGGGDENLDEAFDVSNQDPGFAHVLGAQYTTSTSYTTVLKALLSPYNASTISLTSFGYELKNTGGGWSGTTLNSGSSGYQDVEVGRGFRVVTASWNIGTSSQVTASSTVFRVKADNSGSFTDIATGLPNSTTINQAVGYTPSTHTEVSLTSGDKWTFGIKATDSGSGSNQDIEDTGAVIRVLNRVRVGAYASSSISNITSNAEATTVFNDMTACTLNTVVGTVLNELTPRTTVVAVASAATVNTDNYTWIAYPKLWGDPSAISLLPGVDIAGAFETRVEYDVTNLYGDTNTYYFYRSSITGAYDNEPNGATAPPQKIQISF
jgi:hypothetical protein